MGKSAESRFVAVLEELGFQTGAVGVEGQFKHQDFELAFAGSVDVKARKRISRGDAHAQDDWVWVEFQNGAGRRGWLRGRAMWIAFETQVGFVAVPREPLLEYCTRVIDTSNPCTSPSKAKYRLYRRGLSEIALIKRDDMIAALPHIIINTKEYDA